MDELRLHMYDNNIDVLTLSETFLNDTVDTNAVNINGYVTYRRDRITRTCGGGVILYVNDRFASSMILRSGDIQPNPGPRNTEPVSESHYVSLVDGAIPRPKARGIRFAHINVHSLRSKLDQLNYLLVKSPYDVICINETLCDDLIDDDQLVIPGFSITRRDRNCHGGGVAIYVINNLNFVRRYDLEHHNLESIWLELKPLHRSKILLNATYRPPSSPVSFYDDFTEMLDTAHSCGIEIITMGDFNCNVLDTNSEYEKLHFSSQLFQLAQLINKPTRIESGTAIDLIFVSNPDQYTDTAVVRTSISDHFLIQTVRQTKINKSEHTTATFRSFKHFNDEQFCKDLLQVQFHIIDIFKNIGDAWGAWFSLFTSVLNDHAPVITKRIRHDAVPYMNDEIVELMRQRDAALHNYMAMPTKSPELFQNYKKLRNKVTKELRQVRKNYYTDKIENAQGCPKRIWKTLKELLPRRQNAAPSSVNYNGESFTDSFDIASAFNTHFTSIANNLLDKQGIQRGAATEWKNLQKPNLNRPAFHIPPMGYNPRVCF